MFNTYALMEELEEWEKEELRAPDCDGAYWMTTRGRKEVLEKIFRMYDDKDSSID